MNIIQIQFEELDTFLHKDFRKVSNKLRRYILSNNIHIELFNIEEYEPDLANASWKSDYTDGFIAGLSKITTNPYRMSKHERIITYEDEIYMAWELGNEHATYFLTRRNNTWTNSV